MQVPAYTQELELLAGAGSASTLVEQVRAAEPDSVPLARELFGRWLVHVAGFPDTREKDPTSTRPLGPIS